MKKIREFMLGFLVGVAVVLAVMYGPRYMIVFGNKAEQAGKKLENYKKPVKDAAKGALLNINIL